ncbi:hypothetical protein [Mameliella alba]|uniref:Uncharacterized protein n=1 Tax=Mameliella alba TaxID=561184 RepID=A0A0B3RQQ2_9RHOB|nr:hypothetical protein [Mameliella alba]KHQ50207.1 hypothetical protein OA50_05203 [Mameliella alba]
MKLNNYLHSLNWDLSKTRQAIAALEPLFEVRERTVLKKESELRQANEELREVSIAISTLRQHEGELLSDILEGSDIGDRRH